MDLPLEYVPASDCCNQVMYSDDCFFLEDKNLIIFYGTSNYVFWIYFYKLSSISFSI